MVEDFEDISECHSNYMKEIDLAWSMTDLN